MTAIRFSTETSVNGTAKRARPKETVKPVKSKRATMQVTKHRWAHVGVGMCVLMSVWLNGYASGIHAPDLWTGRVLGGMIPCVVFVLAKVAGMQYRMNTCMGVIRGRKIMLAYVTASVGLGLLALSVWHCACSLSLLTGSHIMLALPMAVAIDCGLVACELDIVLA